MVHILYLQYNCLENILESNIYKWLSLHLRKNASYKQSVLLPHSRHVHLYIHTHVTHLGWQLLKRHQLRMCLLPFAELLPLLPALVQQVPSPHVVQVHSEPLNQGLLGLVQLDPNTSGQVMETTHQYRMAWSHCCLTTCHTEVAELELAQRSFHSSTEQLNHC